MIVRDSILPLMGRKFSVFIPLLLYQGLSELFSFHDGVWKDEARIQNMVCQVLMKLTQKRSVVSSVLDLYIT